MADHNLLHPCAKDSLSTASPWVARAFDAALNKDPLDVVVDSGSLHMALSSLQPHRALPIGSQTDQVDPVAKVLSNPATRYWLRDALQDALNEVQANGLHRAIQGAAILNQALIERLEILSTHLQRQDISNPLFVCDGPHLKREAAE